MKIISPIATGNGAFILHKRLEEGIEGYKVEAFNPKMTFFPPLLYPIGRAKISDIIHTTHDYAVFHKKRGVPMVVTFHNYVLDLYMQAYSSSLQNLHYQTDLKWFTKKSINIANEVTAVSQYTANLVESELNVKKSIKVIYNGVDEKAFRPIKKNVTRKSNIKVLFSGNLTTRKGAHWLLPILEKLPSNISIMYTSGLRGAGELANHSRFLNVGKVPYAEMPKLYRSADMLLSPTVREGLPLAVLEAMACGLPVVATNCSSLPELIDNGKGGFLCGLGDIDGFSSKISLLAENEALRKEMGDYNRVRVEEKFTLIRMISEYQQLFAEMI